MMMAFARGLPQSLTTQLRDQAWPAAERRRHSFLLNSQTVLICGFGEIALRLCELLEPFGMNLIGFRRRVLGTEPIETLPISRLDEYLPQADHIINLLPANDSTSEFFAERRFALMKQTAYFYNIGRGTTVNQASLAAALKTESIAAAYLDVTNPEPLPSDDPLWHLPNCFITPHTAGGQNREMLDLVEHFLANLDRFSSGKPLINRII
jgi:phosphoglycerate dehydrogenase-like enzyme